MVLLIVAWTTLSDFIFFLVRTVRSGTAGFNNSRVIGTFVLSFLAISNSVGLNVHFKCVDRYDSRGRYGPPSFFNRFFSLDSPLCLSATLRVMWATSHVFELKLSNESSIGLRRISGTVITYYILWDSIPGEYHFNPSMTSSDVVRSRRNISIKGE